MMMQHFAKVLLVGVILWGISQTSQASGLTQLQIKNLLVSEALAQGISPALALAIAKVESDFNPKALSHAGARGVMQIMPATALYGFNVASQDLYHADTNIRVGIAYIKQLLEQYHGNLDIALSHYNGGSAVKQANGELKVIPATRDYVHKVKYYAQQYQDAHFSTLTTQQPTIQQTSPAEPKIGLLSYAEQMALDSQPSPPLKNQTPEPALPFQPLQARIGQLQELREHNLTRIMGPKPLQSKAVIEPSQTALYGDKPADNALGRASAGAQRAYRDEFVATQKSELINKQYKVASWEAIYN